MIAVWIGCGVALTLVGILGCQSALAVREIERRHPPTGRFVEVDGVRLHYVERGQGPPVVLMHGASGNLRDMTESLFEVLASDHRVLAFDRPGYGYSERPGGTWPDPAVQARYLRGALHALGIERPLLVGHSWAGALILAYALDYPDEPSGVVAIAPASHPWPGGVAAYRRLAGVPVLGWLFARTLLWPVGRHFADTAVHATFWPESPPPDYRHRTALDLLFRPRQFRADAEDVERLCEFLRTQSPRYAEIRTPLTVLTGTRDGVVSPRLHSKALHAALPHSRLVEIEDGGHALHHPHAERVQAEIRRLTGRLIGSSATARGDTPCP